MSDLRRAVIKNADMSEEMQQEAVDVATTALSKYGIEKDVAAHIKKEFDKKYHPTWHCIVGQTHADHSSSTHTSLTHYHTGTEQGDAAPGSSFHDLAYPRPLPASLLVPASRFCLPASLHVHRTDPPSPPLCVLSPPPSPPFFRSQLRQLRDSRDEELHLLLPGPGGHSALQERLTALLSAPLHCCSTLRCSPHTTSLQPLLRTLSIVLYCR